MEAQLSIIIPTFDNGEYLIPCVKSIIQTGILNNGGELIIINNGSEPVKDMVGKVDNIKVIDSGANLGWEKGLELGLKHTKAPFVVFQNDDTFIPPANHTIYIRMLSLFSNNNIGAVGPETTTAAGWHSIFNPTSPLNITPVTFLIFFMVMIRREALEKAGGIDSTLPGGDDLDLSIRLRKAGYMLVVDPASFIIHHAFKTGSRVKGDSSIKEGWNSREMSDNTNKALIQKHGFRTFFETMNGRIETQPSTEADIEGKIIRKLIKGKKIVELGVGATKTVPEAIGVDWIEKGKTVPHLHGVNSVADVIADVSKPLPAELEGADTVIARHIIEHMENPIEAVKNWSKIVKKGGLLIIATPDSKVVNGIPMNPEHTICYSQQGLKDLMELLDFECLESVYTDNGISFVGVYKK